MSSVRGVGGMCALLLLVSACVARDPLPLERAELEVTRAREDRQVMRYAPLFVQEAEDYYARGKENWEADETAESDHYLYLTHRTLDLARAETERRMALDELDDLQQRAQLRAGALRAESAEARAERYRRESEEQQQLVAKLRDRLATFEAQQTERGLELTLGNDVLFEFDRADLKPGAQRVLQPLAQHLLQNRTAEVIVEGHTDAIGSEAYNRELSQKRALAVARYLEEQGVASARISARGLGEQYPLASNDSEAGRLQNRRVQIVVRDQRDREAAQGAVLPSSPQRP